MALEIEVHIFINVNIANTIMLCMYIFDLHPQITHLIDFELKTFKHSDNVACFCKLKEIPAVSIKLKDQNRMLCSHI